MGYDVTLKPPKEEVEKLKEENKYILTSQSYDKSMYYELIINLYNLEYEKSTDLISFTFKPIYYYLLTMLSHIYETQKKECLQNFCNEFEKDNEVTYCGWDKSNCKETLKETTIEMYLDSLVKCVYCTEYKNKNEKLESLESYLDDFIMDAYNNTIYSLINLFNNYKEESY